MPNRLILVAAFFSLVISIAYYLIPEFRRDVLPVLFDLDLGWLLLALIATLLHYFSEMGRWWFYLRDSTVVGAQLLRRLFAIFSLTAFVTYLLPVKLGVPLRLYLLSSQLRLSFKTASALLLVDGILSYGMWVMATLALYFVLPDVRMFGEFYLYIAAALALLTLAFLIGRSRIGVLLRWQVHFATLKPSVLAASLAVLAVDIAGYILRHGAILWALGVNLAPTQIAFATVVSVTAGFLSMLPMGIGAYDVTLMFLLSIFSVPAEIAVMVPLINRAGNILISVLLGIPASYFTGMSLLTLRQRCKTSPPA